MADPLTRFAPSPTGPLHLGHAYAAMMAAQLGGGTFRLRIEDIDQPRCRPEYETAILEDLAWLGLSWTPPLMRQSTRLDAYRQAIARLYDMGLAYHCTCTRGDIRAALSAPQEGVVQIGPDGPIYPGTCRGKHHPHGALRLDMAAAMARLGEISFRDSGTRPGLHQLDNVGMCETIGDIVLARRDIGTSYHLAVVVDDAAQGITLVSRGEDLFEATALHVLLQRLLGLPTPAYHHHALIRDDQGRRLAKRDDARSLALYRRDGANPEDIRRLIGL